MKTVKIIASSYGYKAGEVVTLPSHLARLLIVKGKAVAVEHEQAPGPEVKAKKGKKK